MDATRPRRIRDSARQGWYALWRSVRFARQFGFASTTALVAGLKPPCPCGAPGGLSVWSAVRRCA
jgi:hypothetical protein